MLPGLRLVLVAVTATFIIVVLGFAQLVKLQVAQSHSAGFGPVEARFAGLAFAERADWTPVAPSPARSLEALAPFGNIPLPRPPRTDRAAADALGPVQAAELDREPAKPTHETRAPDLKPVKVASIGLTAASDASVSMPDPELAPDQPPLESAPEVATREELQPETNPETIVAVTTAPDTIVTSTTTGVRDTEAAQDPAVDAPSSPAGGLTPSVTITAPIEVHAAAVYAPVAPASVQLSATLRAAATPPTAETPPQAPVVIAALPDEPRGDDAGTNPEPTAQPTAEPTVQPAGDVAELPDASVRLPLPRPVLAALPAEAVPMPTPRPAFTPPPRRRAQARPARRAVPRRPAQAKPAPAPAPTNPFAKLFGG